MNAKRRDAEAQQQGDHVGHPDDEHRHLQGAFVWAIEIVEDNV